MKDQYSYHLSPEQYVNACLYRSRRLVGHGFLRIFPMLTTVVFFGAVGYLGAAANGLRSVPSREVGIALIVMMSALVIAQAIAVYGTRRSLRKSRYQCQPRTLTVVQEGLRLTADGSDAFLAWRQIAGAQIHRDMLYVNLDEVSFYPIPVSAFGSGEEAREFASHISERSAAKTAPTSATSGPSADIAPPATNPQSGEPRAARREALFGAAKDALRLAFFRPTGNERPSASWATVLWASLASLALPIVVAFVMIGPKGEWNWYSSASALFHIPLLLATSIVAAYAIRRPSEVPRIMVAGLLISIVIDVMSSAVTLSLGNGRGWMRFAMPFNWVGYTWLALALAAFVSRFVDPGVRRAGIVACCILLVAVPLGSVYHDRSLWYEPYNPDDDDSARSAALGATSEDVYYKQSSLLAQSLDAVRPPASGHINVFFIGMAGYGSQNVFRREVDAVDRLLRERFGASGHTVRLVNNSQTLLDTPIASKTSLRAALNRVGEMMDKERDVLVLYMTSHGSEDHRFSLSLWPLRFHDIDPSTLRQLLDESGIHNRVVIVSACYSGGFVKPLEDPGTLVITASAPDRNSFGCSNEADWTYFGKAYFDESLRTTHSFIKAFELAKPRIEERERKDHFEPSRPQMQVGADIALRLAELERQLDGAGAETGLHHASHAVPAPDKYEQYVGFMFKADYVQELQAACEASMQMGSPQETLAKNPDIFGGLERSPSHWRKLGNAWNTYATELCAKAYDPLAIRGVYAREVRANIPERDLEPAIAFLQTEQGARWIRLEREAARQEMIELGRRQADLTTTLYKRYHDEQSRIFSDFRKSQ